MNNGNCGEVKFQKSSLSVANGQCAEVGHSPDSNVLMRNSRDRDGAFLSFTEDEWRAFVGGVKLGEFDLPTA